jgi:hypothetical protein
MVLYGVAGVLKLIGMLMGWVCGKVLGRVRIVS